MNHNLIWIEVSKDVLRNNLQTIRQNIGDQTLLAPCIKSNAYGHGLIETGKLFIDYGADWLCVNSIEEAIKLRRSGISKPILILGYVPSSRLAEIVENDLRLFVYDKKRLEILNGLALDKINVHLKIDTGMHRQGIMMHEIDDYLTYIKSLDRINLEGVATHFANSDEPEKPEYFNKQLERFRQAKEQIVKEFDHKIIFHCDKSASSLIYPHEFSDLDRPGLACYGYYPSNSVKEICLKKNIILEPALSLKTKVALVKEIDEGSLVGYGCTHKTSRKTRIAMLPIGYYDGFDRKLSNNGRVLINGKSAPILGRVCMNITIVDATDCGLPAQTGEVKQEDEVVLIGRQGDEQITAEEIAKNIGTINYEVTTRLRESIPRYYV